MSEYDFTKIQTAEKILREWDPSLQTTKKKNNRKRRKRPNKNLKKVTADPTFITITQPELKQNECHRVLVTLITKQRQYAVPRAAVDVADNIRPDGLNDMVAAMLKQSLLTTDVPKFDFLVNGTLLRSSLMHVLNAPEQSGLRETGLTIEYLEQLPPPTPQEALNHDDWVSALSYTNQGRGWLLTGCYDHTIHIWQPSLLKRRRHEIGAEASLSDNSAAHKLKIPDAHRAPVKAVAWIPGEDENHARRFISCGMDQAVLVWEWGPSSEGSVGKTVRCVYRCRGHTQSVESLAVSADAKHFATGSWDGQLKLWSTDRRGVTTKVTTEESSEKKLRGEHDAPETKTPLWSLQEHRYAVSGLVWPTLSTLASCSWDNSVRLWDIAEQRKIQQYVAPCSATALDSSPFNNMILLTTLDTHVRLLDPRTNDTMTLVKLYQHHKRFATAVKWSPGGENHFATGGIDKVVKLWDIRSPSTPLYEMLSHDDKVLALDWTNKNMVFSGSADTNVKIFSV